MSGTSADRRAPAAPRLRPRAWAAAALIAAWACACPAATRADDEAPPAPSHDPASAAIRFYQRYLSSLRHTRCRFEPSCSEYALEAIHTYGLVAGTARAADRLVRCDRSSERFYARSASGRMIDPVGGDPTGPLSPRVPPWLLPRESPGSGGFGAPASDREHDAPPGRADEPDPSQAEWGADPARVRELIGFATSLAREGDCDRAATEFRRAAFVAGTPQLEAWTRSRVGACHFAAGAWAVAEPEFLSAAMLSTRARERYDACIMAAACRFDSGDFASCGAILSECAAADEPGVASPAASDDGLEGSESGFDANARARSLGLLGLSALARGNWSTAHDSFQQGIDAEPAGAEARKLAILAARSGDGAELPRKRRRLATGLSIVVPGAGQIYAGRTGEGLRHLFFNGALIYSIVKLVQAEHYPAAVVVGMLETPFYLGNVTGAHNGAAAFNRSRRMEFVVQLIGEAGR